VAWTKILVRAANWVGDAVLSLPALRAIRERNPQAHITLLARPSVADIFEANRDIDRLWVAEETASIRRFREIAARIRSERFDLGLALEAPHCERLGEGMGQDLVEV
jgi:heptosyltransferase-2